MKSVSAKSGFALITVLTLLGVCMILLTAVLGYVSFATRATVLYENKSRCRLAAQSEIEHAKTLIYNGFQASVDKKAKHVGFVASYTFDWFEASSTSKRTIGTTPVVTLPFVSTNNGCSVKTRIARVEHTHGDDWAIVTLLATATHANPGGTVSSSTLQERIQFSFGRSKVFNNAYFVNNYGWFQGSGCTANGDVRANGDMYLDSGAKINGNVYAARNDELGVSGNVQNTGTMDTYSNYIRNSYGTANRARPVSTESSPVAGGYNAPTAVQSSTLKNRINANLSETTEMPYISDLSDYVEWAQELYDNDTSHQTSTLKLGNNLIATVQYSGAGPSGDESLADKGSLVLIGTQSNPIRINGPVVVDNDVIIKGYVTGQGTIYSGRNIHIVGNIQYLNPPNWADKKMNNNNGDKDMLGLMAKGNIVLGDYTTTTWHNSCDTYLKSQPYVQKYSCDGSDSTIGYPSTFQGSYVAKEYVEGGGVNGTGYFPKVRETTQTTYTTETYQEYNYYKRKYETKTRTVANTTTVTQNSNDRRYYESVVNDRIIQQNASTITQVDAILYNNHGIFGKIGSCTFNGALVCRNEGLIYESKLCLNWDIRLYSAAAESVDNNKVGLARSSDNPPTTLSWQEVPDFLNNGE